LELDKIKKQKDEISRQKELDLQKKHDRLQDQKLLEKKFSDAKLYSEQYPQKKWFQFLTLCITQRNNRFLIATTFQTT
jgi:thermostable 8-oxoguanine DNA glycosylase